MSKRTIRVVSAAIEREGRYLITQRNTKAVLPLMWEFPGGRVEDGESDEDALRRELEYRLGVQGQIYEQISATEREYDDYVVVLHLYRCTIGDAEPRSVAVNDHRWVASSEFDAYDFTPADQQSMDALLFGQRQDA